MKMLAIEFSSDHRSVAVLDGENLLAEKTITEGRNTAAAKPRGDRMSGKGRHCCLDPSKTSQLLKGS